MWRTAHLTGLVLSALHVLPHKSTLCILTCAPQALLSCPQHMANCSTMTKGVLPGPQQSAPVYARLYATPAVTHLPSHRNLGCLQHAANWTTMTKVSYQDPNVRSDLSKFVNMDKLGPRAKRVSVRGS